MEPHFLNILSELLDNNKDVNIAHCRVKIIDNDNKLLGYTPLCPEKEDNLNFLGIGLKVIDYNMYKILCVEQKN